MATKGVLRIKVLGDDSGLTKTLDGATSKLGSFAKVGLAAAAAGAVGLSVALYKATGAAVADQAEQAKLATVLRNAAGATDDQIAATERWITKQQFATGISDSKLRPSLSNLVAVTKDVGQAQDLMTVAMDISVGKNLDLETVTKAVGRAHDGNVGALGRLGIATKDASGKTLDFDTVMKNAADTFGGAAADAADTIAGKYQRIKERVGELIESVGEKLLPVFDKLSSFALAAMPKVEAAIGGVIDRIAPVVSDVAAKIKDYLLPKLMSFRDWVAEHWPTIKEILVGALVQIREHIDLLLPALAALATCFAAVKVVSLTNNFIALGTNIAGAALAAGGLVPALGALFGPINIVVLVIAALAAGFVLAWQHSERFRDIVTAVWDKVQAAVSWAWNNVIKPALEALWGFITKTLVPAFSNFMGFLVDEVFPKVAAVVKWAWSNVIKPAFEDLWGYIETVLIPIFRAYWTVAKTVFEAVSTAASTAWSVMKPVLSALYDFVKNQLAPVWKVFSDAAGIAWGALKSIISTSLRIISPLISAFLKVISKIAGAVGMSNLKELADTGVAMVSNWGKESGVGASLNRGGLVPGGGPDRDSVWAYLTPGEMVIPRKVVEQMSPIAREALLDGRLGDIGLNAGGYVKSAQETLAEARRHHGKPYQWAGFGNPSFDCSGYQSFLSNFAVTGSGWEGGRWSTIQATGYPSTLGRFVKGVGDPSTGFSIGVIPTAGSKIGHTAGTIMGVNVESSGSGGVRVGGGARGYTFGSYRYHLPDFGGPSKEMLGWFGQIRDILKGLGKAFTSPIAEMLRKVSVDVAKGAASYLLDEVVPFGSVIKTMVPGLAGGGLVMKPTLAMLGEAGPELVVPVPGRPNNHEPASEEPAGTTTDPVVTEGANDDAEIDLLREIAAAVREVGATETATLKASDSGLNLLTQILAVLTATKQSGGRSTTIVVQGTDQLSLGRQIEASLGSVF